MPLLRVGAVALNVFLVIAAIACVHAAPTPYGSHVSHRLMSTACANTVANPLLKDTAFARSCGDPSFLTSFAAPKTASTKAAAAETNGGRTLHTAEPATITATTTTIPEAVEYQCKHIIAGAGPAGCSKAYFLLQDDAELAVGPTSTKRICIMSPGRNVSGEVDTAMPVWAFPTVGLDTHIPGIKPHYTRDDAEFYYPESSVVSGGSQYNLGAVVPPPRAWFDKIASVTGYASWEFERMLPLMNRPFNFTTPDSSHGVYHGHSGPILMRVIPTEPETTLLARAFANVTGLPFLEDMTQFNTPAVGYEGRFVDIDSQGGAIRQSVCDKMLGPFVAARDPRIVLMEYTYATRIITEPASVGGGGGGRTEPNVVAIEAFNKQLNQVVNFVLPSDGTGKATLGAEVGNVKIMEASGFGDCALLSQLPGGPRPCVLDNPDIGASFKSTFMGPDMVFAIVSGGPTERVNGSIAQAYVVSEFAKSLGNTDIPDIELGIFYLDPGLYIAAAYIEWYPSNSGSVHLSDIDVTSNENSVYNIGSNPNDYSSVIQGSTTIRQAFAAACALFGVCTVEVDGLPTDPTAFAAAVSAGSSPQYHNQCMHPLGLVADEYQNVIGVQRLDLVGGGNILPDLMIAGHASEWFAIISGSKASYDTAAGR
jgi:hypothetical protein